jgi:HSP20 family molecular chaperone IbpA
MSLPSSFLEAFEKYVNQDSISNLESFVKKVDNVLGSPPPASTSLSKTPPYDICEYEDKYSIFIDMPGFEKEDIAVGHRNSTIYINSTRHTNPKNTPKFIHRERQTGPCPQNVIKLPDDVDTTTKLVISYINGVLQIDVGRQQDIVYTSISDAQN